ncbi:MAG: DUF3788 domain-containing protein [Tannerella sp.]|jgi:hypothetical protein|nr:DUF3788 domain-containing protein [Tannerella sp.]
MSNNRPLLNDPSVFPTDEILKNMLAESYTAFEKLSAILNGQGAVMKWKYYNDGKAWLCNVSYKKKTVFWLSVWNGYFKINFYFLERHLEGIAALKIAENSFTLQKEWGKMIPVTFEISRSEQLPDLLKMVEFKKKAK